MTKVSITSTDSFAARAQRSEAKRVALWLAVLVGMALITIVRRLLGGLVMRSDGLFFPYLSALLVGIAGQIVLLTFLRKAIRGAFLLPAWLPSLTAFFDLGIVTAVLATAAFRSPRGPIPALSAPPMLLLPLVILMSVLKLRPRLTLAVGLAATLVHALLAARAIEVTSSLLEAYPVYFAYAGILLLTSLIAMVVSNEVKTHVREAADEAVGHERAQQQVTNMRHDLEIARQIQIGLLPKQSPKLPGFDIAAMNRPADQTGGDYYDWQQLPDGRLAVALADVTGHGIGPAMVMAVCRAYARSTAPTTSDPAELLTRLNELIHEDLPADRFITFVVAVLDADGTTHLQSAGHGPTLLYRANDRSVEQFGGDGMPLGISPVETYGPTTTFQLAEGDVLVMLTDGFFEASRASDGQLFGIARLCDSLRERASCTAETMLHDIDETVRQFAAGTPQLDDMTAIVIKRITAG